MISSAAALATNPDRACDHGAPPDLAAGEAVVLPGLDFVMDAGEIDQNEVRLDRRAIRPAVQRLNPLAAPPSGVGLARYLDVHQVAERRL